MRQIQGEILELEKEIVLKSYWFVCSVNCSTQQSRGT